MLLIPFVPFASATEDGVSDYLYEHIYLNPDAENEALEAGDIDMIDWPLTKEWIDRWTGDPDIVLRNYAEIGLNILDMNCQLWPTGVTMPRDEDPATGTFKHYYDDGGTPDVVDTWDDVAAEFRKAIAHLTDKDAIIRDVVKGYGYRMDTTMPTPALGGYTDYGALREKGLIYDYDPYAAEDRLDDAGFEQGSTTNPYYPDEPEGWEAINIREDPRYGGDLQPLEFYIRLDDPERTAAGIMIRDNLRKMGIPVNDHIVEKSTCYQYVMVVYDFHLYTGGWQLSADVDFLYWLWAAEMYFGGNATSHYGGVGWSLNYEGFCTPEFDEQAIAILEATTATEVKTAALIAQEVMQKYCHSCPLWCSAAFKAYGTGWDGVVNMEGYGVNNGWSFMNMYKADDNQIDYGFKSNLEGPQVITSEWVWDHEVTDYCYDGLIGLNPYNFAEDIGFLAESWSTGLWSGGMWCKFNLVDGATFHDGSPVEAYDVAFSEIFPRDCGTGVCWYITSLVYTEYVEIQSIPSGVPSHTDIRANSALAADEIVVYLNIVSYFGLHWAGGVPILNSAMWLAANSHTDFDWGWPGPSNDGTGWDRMGVRDYHPWQHDVYDASTEGMGSDGTYDFCQDGAGAWTYHSTEQPDAISASTWVLLERYADYYMSNTDIAGKITYWFHLIGNVNYPGSTHEFEYAQGTDMSIDSIDGSYIFRGWGTTHLWPAGIDWQKWNCDCDFKLDNKIDASDLYQFAYNFGRVSG
jgi:ABC-type transport system substrate-binding protein